MLNKITVLEYKDIAIVEFSPGHRHNPFSGERMDALFDTLVALENNENIKVIILYGGKNNSFSVGGDFNEVSNFTGGEEVEKWLDSVNNLYAKVLQLSKPVIATIDNYAIGFGFQLALMCDYRIGSTNSQFKMPEFAMGIACNFGGYILDKFVNRSFMQRMLFDCEAINAIEAKNLDILHDVVDSEILLDFSIKKAEKFALYNPIPIKETKKSLNEEVIKGLDQICSKAKNAHKKSFATGVARTNMLNIIKA